MARRKQKKKQVLYELKMIALIAGTLFAMLSIYTDAVGVVGQWITDVVLGLFSYVGFALPIGIFALIFVNLNPNFKPVRKRVRFGVLVITVMALLMNTLLLNMGARRQALLLRPHFFGLEGISQAYSGGMQLTGGGVFGDVLTGVVLKLVGEIGAYVIIIALAVIALILLTRVSLQELWHAREKRNLQRKKAAAQSGKQKQRKEDGAAKPEAGLASSGAPMTPGQMTSPGKPLEENPHFLTALGHLHKSGKQKRLRQFDSDSYEGLHPDPVPMAEKSDSPPATAVATPLPTPEPQVPGKEEVASAQDVGILEGQESQVAPSVPAKSTRVEVPSPEQEARVIAEIEKGTRPNAAAYRLPSLALLKKVTAQADRSTHQAERIAGAKRLEETLNNFNVDAKVVSVKEGPSITMYEIQLSPGIKVSKVVNLSDDIALNMATSHVRIAPIPGKVAIGVEVPNSQTSMVTLREVISAEGFQKSTSKLAIGLGKDISGNAIIGDLAGMPHLLIAGATGSGKSVCVNTLIASILFHARPDEVKFLMIDPKVVELSNYNGIPHLILPVVTDPKKAAIALNWAVNEMTRRYTLFAEEGVRDLKAYNAKAQRDAMETLPQIVVIIDELADLMMVAPNQVEDAICRLAQMARAAGLHLIVATQRPSVDVITGLIKANIPSRIAFSVSSSVDSRTIIDMGGAEKLLGKGDMLYYPVGASKPKRVQGAFVSDAEIEALVEDIKNQGAEVDYNEDILEETQRSVLEPEEEVDAYLEEAIQLVVESGQASASLMQRRFRVGYNRAARLIDAMEERGVVGPHRGSKPREVLIDEVDYRRMTASEALEEETSEMYAQTDAPQAADDVRHVANYEADDTEVERTDA